jgi:hypothetical protein
MKMNLSMTVRLRSIGCATLNPNLSCSVSTGKLLIPHSIPCHLYDISDFQKFLLTPDPNQLLIPSVPALSEGTYHDRLGRWAWDAMDAAALRAFGADERCQCGR